MINSIDILNGLPHAAALLDPQLRITAINNSLASLSGYSGVDVQNLEIWQVSHAAISSKDIQPAIDSGQAISKDSDIISSNRKKIPIRFTFSPLHDEKGRLEAVLTVMEDISALSQLNIKYQGNGPTKSIIGSSPKLQEVLEMLPMLSLTDATVLITGETGAGKDLLAEEIHRNSKRAQHPFIKVNCAAIPDALLESELFGSVKGAYTGANTDKPGMFRLAQGGTIFLTEIGDLPLQLQVKLLTVLDDREFYPLGSSRKVSVDVRIITGTHRNLKDLVREGKFREDLYFRLNVLRAHLPPLRERAGDIPMLLEHFMQKISSSANKNIRGASKAARAILEDYDYPGNIRELRNIVEYAVNLCRHNLIDVDHLPPSVVHPEEMRPAMDISKTVKTDTRGHNFSGDASPVTASSWTELEKRKILNALLNNNGNRTLAAKELGWSRSTLWRKINQYDIG